MEPGTSISRLLESAVIQAAAATAGVCTPLLLAPGADVHEQAFAASLCAEVELQSRMEASGRITAVRSSSGSSGSSGDDATARAEDPVRQVPPTVLAPLCVLAHRALPVGADGKAASAALCTLGGLLDRMLREGQVINSWRLEPPLDLSTPDAARMADTFFRHYASMHQRLCWELQQAASASTRSGADDLEPGQLRRCTLVQLEEQLNRMGIAQAAAFTGEVRLPSGGSGCEPYGGFRSVFAHWVGGYQASLESSAANPLVKNYKHLPSRFLDATCFAHKARREHPCYSTSSAEYGAKKPTGLDMPLSWAGVHGRFTNTFCGGPAISPTMKTHNIRSRVHRALDEL
ncbi:hypothetical protein MNEG_4765 [Monoraphidium neglectum]|uniref:Uncharacterized protein n=1 Tax=Monoraphidium neglectum TaxID=145388 RepID=A0A0D2MJP7_9CHLO|nr:hypothetical protein MNEG_4765 [Monoraphidium neglectum]KIZ03195.1 hypothetical protein MNEG_4765 [Monoraphidium neglectum]|eukprot:XP_013902214.1 hypothetical protein MNEG_4765 [Monoraphidium neglectum]